MSDQLVFLVLGLGSGAVFAALGFVLVVTYRSSGVVNFGAGAIALYIAYTYAYLRQGKLVNPIPPFPGQIDLHTGPLAVGPAIAISLVVAAILGLILYLVVFRPLRNAAPAVKAVASIGVMLFLQSLLALQLGTSPVSVAHILPTDYWTLGGTIRISSDRIYFAAIIVVLAVIISIWFKLSRFGLATRAASESEKGALITGLSPERIAMVNWALSTVVAGISGILIATITPLQPASFTLYIVPALAAALVGNFTNISLTVVAGLVIGMLESWLVYLQGVVTWFPQSGAASLVPLVLIIGFLLIRGQSLPSRGAIIRKTIGSAPRPKGILIPGAIFGALCVIALLLTTGSWRGAIIVSLIFAVIGMSQVVITGYAGQISLAQIALAGVAAFSLSVVQTQMGIPFPIGPIIAIVVAAIFGVIVGLPALRVRGLPVAIATLALAVAVQAIWFDNPQFDGGLAGSPVTDPTLFGFNFGVGTGRDAPTLAFGLFVLIVTLACAAGVAWLRLSRLGASMLAIRANERSAAAVGINVGRTKLIAFAISGVLAGVGGVLLAYQQNTASPSSYTALGGIGFFATIYLVGVTSLSGGITAGFVGGGGVVFLIFSRLLPLGDYYGIVNAVLLIVTVIMYPDGFIKASHELIAKFRAKTGFTGPKRRTVGSTPLAASAVDEVAITAPVFGDVLLSVDNVSVRYGGVVAVDSVSFSVRSGEILGLIGPNGAGKTTLIDAITGFAHSTGSVTLGDDKVDQLPPHQRVRAGLGRTFQNAELYEDLTVVENVEVGTIAAIGRDEPGMDLDLLLERMQLADEADRPVRELSQGHRQLVSVSRGLAGQPRLLLVDEPAGGLDSTESQWLAKRLLRIRDHGTTIVMVDHDMDLVLGVCDRIVVLDLGKVIAIGTPAEIQNNPVVVAAYLGAPVSEVETV